ncbi:LytR/AlgR family response regulator transcription factor [Portibacter lacus]|uniref:DNA-binding response regulator n=1 Tax=Portibacter lacus TaxID=1099794 RepID=A0AA37ST47_9BACT|nr:LytTR family DNA-binding domain-containing protein [Portibacter lacus]GLR19657.1 DNA-binding response regulator [Portibacter lacus]
MIKCLIIEDEDLAARRLERLIKESDRNGEYLISHRCQSISESVKILKEEEFDLIFLDVHLTDGLSFKIFEQVETDIPIIFTTAYDQYAIEAFKQNSVDYLLKPIQKDDLVQSLSKYQTHFTNKSQQLPDYQALANAINHAKSPFKQRFMVQIADKIRTVDASEIHYFYAENKTTYLITENGKRYYVNHTLAELESLLDPQHFFRVNRKVIIRINSLVEVLAYSRSKLKVILKTDPGFQVFVPAEKISGFKDWLN